MFQLFVVFAKYLLTIMVVMYTFYAFDAFIIKKQRLTREMMSKMSEREIRRRNDFFEKDYERRKSTVFGIQYALVMMIHTLCFAVLFLKELNLAILILGIVELGFIITVSNLYQIVYDGISKLLLNNMLFLMDMGFILICRLNWEVGMKQFIVVLVCSAICLAVPVIIEKFDSIDKYDWIYLSAGLGLLVLVIVVGEVTYGAKNWIALGNRTFQPSEFVKIIFIFSMASLLSKYAKDLKKIIMITILAGAHVAILALQKDLGSALLFFVTYLVMLYIATKKRRYVGIGALLGGAGATIAYNIPNFRHVRVRVNAWKDPWSTINGDGYQVAQSLFAIGTGGWFGMGLTKGLPQSIPVRFSDFIFAVLCEEMGGIVGIMVVLICLSCFIMFVNIAMLIRKLFYKLIAIGLSTMYIFQVLLTVGGATKFIPSTGVTLPLISYGGSSIFSTLVVFSVVQGLYVRKSAT